MPSSCSRCSNVTAVPYIGAPQAWQDYGYTGKGVKIGIIDTGIDYYHADFGGSGKASRLRRPPIRPRSPTVAFPTAKVAGGYDFAGDGYDATGDNGSPTPAPDPDPLDCGPADGGNGHGTHVAGTAAGEGVLADGSTYTGPYNAATIAAPLVEGRPRRRAAGDPLLYKVFGCEGATDLTVDAINRAVADGVDVISMSLGGALGFPSPDDPERGGHGQRRSRLGSSSSAAAGNSGPNAYVHDSPGCGDRRHRGRRRSTRCRPSQAAVVSLGSGDIPAIDMNAATLPLTGKVDAITDTATTLKLGCSADDFAGIAAGAIVVVQRGVCAFVDKGKNAQDAGASAIIVANRDDTNPGDLPTFLGAVPSEFTIPMIGTDKTAIPALIAADGQSATLKPGPTLTNPTYQQTADFSSGGPREGDSHLKPDVTAPGVNISSAFVASGTEAQTLSGTSMATPMTSGVAALVVQAHPNWSPTRVKAAIMNTASADASLIQGYDPRLNGSGVIQPRLGRRHGRPRDDGLGPGQPLVRV